MMNEPNASKILDAFPVDVPSKAILTEALEGRSKERLITDDSVPDRLSAEAAMALAQSGSIFIGRGISQRSPQSTLSELRRDRREYRVAIIPATT
jgi:hypothetical protein